MVIFMDANEKYKAVISCDGNFDGSFLYGVKSTGIYCRPSCRSKKPSFENTVFFASAEDAENEGFRPCKRCRPDLEKYDAASSAAEQIKNIIDIHFSDTLRLRDEIAKSGFSRGHITRLFEDRYGISVKEYINSVRLSKAKELLENGVSVTDVAFASGYESTAAFSSFFKRQSGISPREYASDFGLRNSFGCLKTPVGLLFISESKAGITSVKFAGAAPQSAYSENRGIYIDGAKRQLQEYFSKKRRAFDLPLDLRGSEFQKKVWTALQEIPYGETRSYQDIAALVGNPKASRAVGMANNRNPVVIAVPCHRVIGKNGKLVGYAGGISRKEYLLKLERENME